MLKHVQINRLTVDAESQTFSEGKGVETAVARGGTSDTGLPGRRPSQKVKVLKQGRNLVVVHQFPFSRRPSQKVKVLKLEQVPIAGVVIDQSQTFPEGKGVETPPSPRRLPATPRRRPSQKV